MFLVFKNVIDFFSSDKFYMPVLIVVVGVLGYKIISKTIVKVSKVNKKINSKINQNTSVFNDKRKSTVVSLINNVIKYTIAIIVIIAILNIYGVNTRSLTASLGIASAIVGLAFQDIIKDFLSGIFIIFDNDYAVGDWITIDGFKGEVIQMGLRTTKIRAYTGEIMSISNSAFNKVINYNLGDSRLFISIPFGYDEKVENVERVLDEVLKEIKKERNIKKTELLGVEEFEDSCIKYAVAIECKPNTHIATKRLFLRNVKSAFDENNIVIPYNKLDIHIEK